MIPFYNKIEHFGTHIALVTEEGQSVTYAALTEEADTFRSVLQGSGLGFLLADNCPESVIGYLGFLRAKVPLIVQPASLHADLLANLLKVYQPNYVWLPKKHADQVRPSTTLFVRGNYILAKTSADPVAPYKELALLLSTSGSTGSPKFVRQSYRNIAANADAIAQYLQINKEDRPISTLPMHYVFGLSVLNSHFLRGSTIILTKRSLMEKAFWDLLIKAKATSFAGVPYTYEMLKRLHFESMDLPSLKILTQAGGKLDSTLVREFAEICSRKGMQFYVMYGAAEATARMSYLPPAYALQKPESIGIPIPGGEFWIEGKDGSIIETPGIVGELVYRGDNVTLGYASCREDLARGGERDGVLYTGDLAWRDHDGFYYIVGRINRFLKIYGNRINLEEIEQHIRVNITDCACAGRDDELHIYITDESKQSEVSAFISDLTGLHHSAFAVIVLGTIPRNEFGKITYSALL